MDMSSNNYTKYVLLTLVIIGTLVSKYSVFGQASTEPCSRRLYAKNGTGVVASYNYPFQYWTDMDCEYSIWLPDNNNDICFTFLRFNMMGNGSTEASLQNTLGDYLEFQANGKRYKYHQNGKVFDTSGVQDNWLTVWDDNFCWPVTTQEFVLHMVSDTTGVGTGFYATYELKAASPNRTSSSNVPCTDSQWTCFDGGCVNLEQVCDGQISCTDGSDETYFHARCGAGSLLACDFNTDCGFTGISSNAGWVIESESDDPYRGPSADHTRGNIHTGGSYARTDFYTDRTSTHLMMYDDTSLPVDQDSCLSFWYLMGDFYPGKLEVFYEQLNKLSTYPDLLDGVHPIWVRDGNFGKKWLHAEIFIPKETVTRNERIIFMATRTKDVTLQIAVDDISLIPGKCFGDDVGCNFEEGMCGWSVRDGSPENRATWELTRRTGSALGPYTDASRSTSGHYIMLYNRDNAFFQTEDQLVTEPIIVNGRDTYELCLTMAYFVTGAPDALSRPRTITVTAESLTGQQLDRYIVQLSDSTQNDLNNQWIRVEVTMTDIKEPFKISLRPEFFTYPVVLALDEIAVIQGRCADIKLGSCGIGRFRCSNGQCIQRDDYCSYYGYCSDGSDGYQEICRLQCVEQCGLDKYCCDNGLCIDASLHCDGFNDCGDWDDEKNCKSSSTCKAPMLWCVYENYYTSNLCMDESYICNGENDCGNEYDETDCDKIGSSGLSSGDIAGIVIGVLIGIAVIIAVIIGCIYLHHRESEAEATNTYRSARSAAYQETRREAFRAALNAARSEGRSGGRNEDRSEGRNDTRSESPTETPTDASAPTVDPDNQRPPGYYKALNHPDIYRKPDAPKSQDTTNQSASSHTQPSTEPVVLPPAYDRIESGEYIVAADSSHSELDQIRMEVMQGPREAVDSGHPIPREAPPPYTPTAGATHVVEEATYSAETSSIGDQSRPRGRQGRRNRCQSNQRSPTAPSEETNHSDGATNIAFEPECSDEFTV